MMPMTMPMGAMSAYRKWKGKNCYNKDLSLSKSDNDCYRSEHNCFGKQNAWTKKSKMMQILALSNKGEDNNSSKHEPWRLMFLHGSSNSNSKPNWQKRMRRRMQIWFLRPSWNRILNLFTSANDNIRSESVSVTGEWLAVLAKNPAWRWSHTKRIWHDRFGKSTRMHARLNYWRRYTVDPSWMRERIMVDETVKTRGVIERSITRWLDRTIGVLRVLRSSPYQSLIRTKSCWVKR